MSLLLVTGGAGFVMAHVVRQWLDADTGHRALVLDIAPPDAAARGFLGERAGFVQGSVTDPELWEALPRGITHVVHGAAVTSIAARVAASGIAGALGPVETNITGTLRALAFAERLGGLRRFVNVSSGAVYARSAPVDPVPEDGFVGPEGWYSASKYGGEMMASAAAAEGMPVLSVRLSGVFGPLDRETGARAVHCPPKQLAHAARAGRRMRLAGLAGGGDHIHAGDVAAAILGLLACARPRHAIYNIAHGRFTTLGALAAMVPGLDWEEVAEGADLAGDPALTTARWGAYDISRIAAETGWRPRPLEAAIADYCDWLRDHEW